MNINRREEPGNNFMGPGHILFLRGEQHTHRPTDMDILQYRETDTYFCKKNNGKFIYCIKDRFQEIFEYCIWLYALRACILQHVFYCFF